MKKENEIRARTRRWRALIGTVRLFAMILITFMIQVLYGPQTAEAVTYYMGRDTATNLTADGTCNVTGLTPYTSSTQPGKTTTLATDSAGASRYYPVVTAGTTTTVLKVYTPVYSANAVDISAISASAAMRGVSTSDTVKLDLYDYDPAGAPNNGTLVASTSVAKPITSTTGQVAYTWAAGDFTINGTGRVAQGHRLQFRFTYYSLNAGNPRFYFGVTGSLTSTNFTVTETPVSGAVAPTVGSPTAMSIAVTTATLGGNVTSDGGAAITARGTVWGTTAAPTTNPATTTGTTGVFTHARTGLPAQTLVYYRAFATNASGTGYSSDGSFYTEPTTQASGVSFSGVLSTSMTVTWTRGSGGATGGVLVLMKANTAVTGAPTDGAYTTYTANTAFGGGTLIGDGYVVYKGTGTSVAVTGLTASTTYHIAVYEFAGQANTAGDAQGTNYKMTPATGNRTTGAGAVAPTVTTPTAATIAVTTATLGGNVTSDGGAALTRRGTVWGTAAAPTGNALAEGGTTTGVFTHGRTSLTAGTLLYYRAFATNATGTGFSPDGSFYTEPATQASAVSFPSVSSTGMTINWTRGSGNGVIVLMKSATAVNSDPSDGTYTGYTANLAFGSGTQIGTGNYVVYKGTGTSAAITGLSASTTYHVAVYEYAGTVDTAGTALGTNYKLTAAIGNQATTGGSAPSPPTGISLSNMMTSGPTITWNAVSGATTYSVYRSTDGSTWGATIGGVGAPATLYTDTAAPKPNTVYYWTVTASNANGESTKPAGVSGKTALYFGYNMVSAPYNTTGQSPIAAFGAWANWPWIWNSSSNVDPDNSGTWNTPLEVTPGKGMFLWAYNNWTVLSASGSANPAALSITLVPGWNMVSNQTLTNMSNIGASWMVDGSTTLTNAVSGGTIGGALSWWDGVQYQSLLISGSPVIEPWKAYFILNQTGVNHTLTIQ